MIANQTGEPQTSIAETLNAWRTRRRGSPLFVEALADVLTNGRGVLTMPARRPQIPPDGQRLGGLLNYYCRAA
jgi:hypothetical protein